MNRKRFEALYAGIIKFDDLVLSMAFCRVKRLVRPVDHIVRGNGWFGYARHHSDAHCNPVTDR